MFALSFRSQHSRNRQRSNSCRPRIEWMEPRTLLSAVSWTGGGGDNNWDTAANWNTDSVPGSGDDVTIAIAANVAHSNAVTDSIHSLTSTQPLTISGGTLSIASASTIGNTLSITGGTLTGPGDVSVGGLVTLTSGTLSGSGALDANGGMLINPGVVQGGIFSLDGRTVNNAAGQTATWSGNPGNSGDINASDGSVFNNLGTFLAESLGLYQETGVGAPSTFNNVGNITANATGIVEIGVSFQMTGGSVDIQSNGQIDFAQGSASQGAAFNVESNGALELFAQFTVDPTTTITGSGALVLDGSMVLPANYAFTGSTEVGGTVQVDGSLAGSPVDVSGSGDGAPSASLSGTGTVGPLSVGSDDGDSDVSPGDDGDPGILNVQGPADFEGTVDDSGDQDLASLTVELNGPTAGTGYSQLNVNGAVQLGSLTFLNASLGFTPTQGEQFTIVQSTAPVVGTFQGLSEGASLTIGNTPFTISYAGGGGDDIVLTAGTPAVAAPPTVTGLSPSSGPAAGGTSVTITGIGFTGATAVDFGTTAATDVVVVNDTTITADSPAGSGVADVTVTTPIGTSAKLAPTSSRTSPPPPTWCSRAAPRTP